jgi:hypothetical protein
MGLEDLTCNNCKGQLQISKYIEGTMFVVKTNCKKCGSEGISASTTPDLSLPEWYTELKWNGKKPGRLA